jgi:Na+:H+ antiporter, NhaA family
MTSWDTRVAHEQAPRSPEGKLPRLPDRGGLAAVFRHTPKHRGSRPGIARFAQALRKETVGGALTLTMATVALLLANSPWSEAYEALRSYEVGPSYLHLRLSLASWAADGLLAVFFFIAGLELKREFVVGDLRDPRRALVPVTATIGGVVVPAALYLTVNALARGSWRGWAIPTATDVAFALSVLAVVGRHLPPMLRTFLLALAVIDDLAAIVIIAIFYTAHLDLLPLVAGLFPLAAFIVLVQRRVRSGWLLPPLAVATWALVHASGVHATVAGALLGFAVPVVKANGRDPQSGLAEHFERIFRPISASVAVPVFAFFAAGVTLDGVGSLSTALADPVLIGTVVGLLIGKPLGIIGGTWLVRRYLRARAGPQFAWPDIFGLATLAGIGFTVSLLVGELAFGPDSDRGSHVKVAILAGSIAAAILGVSVLRRRDRIYRSIGGTPGAGPSAPQTADRLTANALPRLRTQRRSHRPTAPTPALPSAGNVAT